MLLGVYLVRQPNGLSGAFWLSGQPELLTQALLCGGLAGAGVGLLHSLLIVGLRLPAVFVTLTTGTLLALGLLGGSNVSLSVADPDRIPTLLPTLALFGLAGVLLCVFAALTARQRRHNVRPPAPLPPARQRLAGLLRGTWLAFPSALALGLVAMSWNELWNTLRFLLLFGVAAATVGGLAWAYREEDAESQRSRVRRITRLTPLLLLPSLAAGCGCAWR